MSTIEEEEKVGEKDRNYMVSNDAPNRSQTVLARLKEDDITSPDY